MNNTERTLHWELIKFDQLSNEELYELIALRSQVFVVEQNCVYQDLDFKDQNALHLLGKNDDGKLIAYTRLFDVNQYYEGYLAIGRVITHKDFRKYGYGIELMEKSIELCQTTFGEMAIKIGAQKYLTKFYGLLGFKETGEDYIEDGIPHCIMIRDI
ncbi:MAG: ElaA protein [Arcticibacterium sp.]|jgi:ElaA protein